jgi:hypothetical protein
VAHFDGAGAAAFSPELSRAGYLETDEEIAQARTRRPVVWGRLHAIDATRVHLTMK